jgi:hypothetical protein
MQQGQFLYFSVVETSKEELHFMKCENLELQIDEFIDNTHWN